MESSSLSQDALIQKNGEKPEEEEDEENGEESEYEEDMENGEESEYEEDMENGDESKYEEDMENTKVYEIVELSLEDRILKKRKFEENEIVWATIEDRFWPALLHKIGDEEVVIYFIDRPNKDRTNKTNVHMLVPVEDLYEELRSFDDEKFNEKVLREAEELPDPDMLIQAYEKVDTFLRRGFYTPNVDGFSFFQIAKYVEYSAETKEDYESDESIIEENLTDNKEITNVDELMQCIFAGKCDKHITGIYKEKIKSELHDLYFIKDFEKLKHKSWCGAFKDNPQRQISLYSYLARLFQSNFSKVLDMESYIYNVWVPEAIVQAICIVKHVCLLEAQIMYLRLDLDRLDTDDFHVGD